MLLCLLPSIHPYGCLHTSQKLSINDKEVTEGARRVCPPPPHASPLQQRPHLWKSEVLGDASCSFFCFLYFCSIPFKLLSLPFLGLKHNLARMFLLRKFSPFFLAVGKHIGNKKTLFSGSAAQEELELRAQSFKDGAPVPHPARQ